MPSKFPDSELENVVIDESDQTQLFDRRDEFAADDDAPPHIAHAQQALEIIRLPRRRANHGLECEKQPVLAAPFALPCRWPHCGFALHG